MKIIDDIFGIARSLHDTLNMVTINYDILETVSEQMLREPLKKKQVDANKIDPSIQEVSEIILKELVADSVNYCYWLGSSDFRPHGAGSTKMREILDITFNARLALSNELDFEMQLRNFHRGMMMNRFPLMDKRREHLMALNRKPVMQAATNQHGFRSISSVARRFVGLMTNETVSFEHKFNFLITNIDGFGDDPFLKRAVLFFLQLNRILGWYEEDLREFPIPADYQVPKMLMHYGILEYDDDVMDKVMYGVHLPENSPEELSIRAAAILACDEIAAQTDLPVADVDGWFFVRRNESQLPFHLCITSNY